MRFFLVVGLVTCACMLVVIYWTLGWVWRGGRCRYYARWGRHARDCSANGLDWRVGWRFATLVFDASGRATVGRDSLATKVRLRNRSYV